MSFQKVDPTVESKEMEMQTEAGSLELIKVILDERNAWIGEYEHLLHENMELQEAQRRFYEEWRPHDLHLSIEHVKELNDSFQGDTDLLERQFSSRRTSEDRNRLGSMVTELQKQLEEEQVKIKGYSTELETSQKRTQNAEQEVQALRNKLDELEQRDTTKVGTSVALQANHPTESELKLSETLKEMTIALEEKEASGSQMRQKIYHLEVRLDELNQLINQRDTENEILLKRCERLETCFKEAKEALDSQTPLSVHLENESKLLAEIQKVEEERDQQSQKTEKYRLESESLREIMEEMAETERLWEKQLKEKQDRIIIVENELETALKDLEETRKLYESAKESLELIKSEHTLQLEYAHGAREVYEKENIRLHQKVESLKLDLSKYQDEIKDLSDEKLNQATNLNRQLSQENTDLRKRLESVKEEMNSIKSESTIKLRDNEPVFQMEEKVLNLTIEPENSKHSANLQKETELRQKIDRLEEVREKNIEIIKELNEDTQQLNEKVARLESEHKKKLKDLKSQLEDTLSDLNSARADKKKLLETLSEKEQSQSGETPAALKEHSIIDSIKEQATLLEAECQNLKNELETHQVESRKMASDHQELKTHYDTLISQNLDQELADLKAQLKDKTEECQNLAYRLSSVFEVLRKKQFDNESLAEHMRERVFQVEEILGIPQPEDDDADQNNQESKESDTKDNLNPRKLGPLRSKSDADFDHKELVELDRKLSLLITQMSEKLENLSKELETSKTLNNDLEELVKQTEERLRTSQNRSVLQLEQKNEEITSLEAQVKTLRSEMHVNNQIMREIENEKNKNLDYTLQCEKELEYERENVRILERRVEDTTRDLEKSEARSQDIINDLKSCENQMQMQAEEAHSKIVSLEDQLSDVYRRLENAEHEIGGKDNELGYMDSQLKSLTRELDQARKNCEDYDADIRVYKNNLEDKSAQINQLQTTIEEQQELNDRISLELNLLKSNFLSNNQYFSLESQGREKFDAAPMSPIMNPTDTSFEARSLQVKIDELEHDYREMDRAVRSCYNQLIEDNPQISERNDEQGDIKRNLSLAIDNLRLYVRSLQMEVQEKDEQIQGLKDQFDREKAQSDNIEKGLTKELNRANEERKVSEENRKWLKDRNYSLEKELLTNTKVIEEISEEKVNLEKTVQLQDKTISDLLENIESLRKSEADIMVDPDIERELVDRIADLETEVDNLNKTIATKEKMINVFVREVHAFQDMLLSDPDQDAPVELALGILNDLSGLLGEKKIQPEAKAPKESIKEPEISETKTKPLVPSSGGMKSNKNVTLDIPENKSDFFSAGAFKIVEHPAEVEENENQPLKDSGHLPTFGRLTPAEVEDRSLRQHDTDNLNPQQSLSQEKMNKDHEKTVKQLRNEVASLKAHIQEISKIMSSSKKSRSAVQTKRQAEYTPPRNGSSAKQSDGSISKSKSPAQPSKDHNGYDTSEDYHLKLEGDFLGPETSPNDGRIKSSRRSKEGGSRASCEDLENERDNWFRQVVSHYKKQIENFSQYGLALKAELHKLTNKLNQTEKKLIEKTKQAQQAEEEIKLLKITIRENRINQKLKEKEKKDLVTIPEKLAQTSKENKELVERIEQLRQVNASLSKSVKRQTVTPAGAPVKRVSPVPVLKSQTRVSPEPRQNKQNTTNFQEKIERGLQSIHLKLMEFINKNYVSMNQEVLSLHRDLTMKLVQITTMVERLQLMLKKPETPLEDPTPGQDTLLEIKQLGRRAQELAENYAKVDEAAVRLGKNVVNKNKTLVLAKIKELIRHSESERVKAKADALSREEKKTKDKLTSLAMKTTEVVKGQVEEIATMVADRASKLAQIRALCGEAPDHHIESSS